LIEVARIGFNVPILFASWFLIEQPLIQWRRKALESAPAAQMRVVPQLGN
jgi:peptidoglycan/LPS O-acetylase OafA/YrhL